MLLEREMPLERERRDRFPEVLFSREKGNRRVRAFNKGIRWNMV
uniref:Uncharacterized protein n=1 Tax=Nelumbo nucifera TaxID=4432 RepID=A0A822YJR9_NELNU|nr:TPA_asm: hypothetical protein HUJ06_011608 [Nelumbo nucifera]